MTRRISVEQAQAEFPQLLDEMAEGGERIIIERPGKAQVELMAAKEAAQDEEPQFQADDWLAPLIGAWGAILTDGEIDAMVADIYADRERDHGRTINLEAQDS